MSPVDTHLPRLSPLVKFLSQRNGSKPEASSSRLMRLTWLLSMAWMVMPAREGGGEREERETGEGEERGGSGREGREERGGSGREEGERRGRERGEGDRGGRDREGERREGVSTANGNGEYEWGWEY